MKLQFTGWSAEVRVRSIPPDFAEALTLGTTDFIELEIEGATSNSIVAFRLSEAEAIGAELIRVAQAFAAGRDALRGGE